MNTQRGIDRIPQGVLVNASPSLGKPFLRNSPYLVRQHERRYVEVGGARRQEDFVRIYLSPFLEGGDGENRHYGHDAVGSKTS